MALATGALAVVTLAACGGATEESTELVAVPYPEQEANEDVAAEPDPATQEPAARADDAEEPGAGPPEATQDEDAAGGGLPLSDVRAFLAARDEGVDSRDHLLADLTDDGTHELVVALVAHGRARVEIARWDGDDLALAVRRGIGPADELGRLRLAELGGQTSRLLILPSRHEGAVRIDVWVAGDGGGLRSPADCPLDGVVALRSSVGQRHELRCEPGPARDALVWDEGSFQPQALLDGSATAAVETAGQPGPGEGPNG